MSKSNGASNGGNGQNDSITGGVFICLYGPSKSGKTVASAAAGARGLFIGDPAGLLSAQTFLGLKEIKIASAKLVPEATAAIEAAVSVKNP